MTTRQRFKITVAGIFHSFEIYTSNGRHIFDSRIAAERAEEIYGNEWCEVFNGTDGISRDEYLEEVAKCG